MSKIKLKTILENLNLNLDLSEGLLNIEVEDFKYNSFEYEDGVYNIISDEKYVELGNRDKGAISIFVDNYYSRHRAIYPDIALILYEGPGATLFNSDGTRNYSFRIN